MVYKCSCCYPVFGFLLILYSQSDEIHGFKHLDEYLATRRRERLIDPILYTRHWGYRGGERITAPVGLMF